MTAITASRTTETIIESVPTSRGHEKRRATDKYWIFLLIAAIVIWIQAGPRVTVAHPKRRCRFYDDDSTTTNSTSECNIEKKNRTDCEVDTQKTPIFKDTVEYVIPIWGKNWLFDAITFNVGFLEENYERSGSIVLWAHIFFCTCLIIYSYNLLRTDKIYRSQFGAPMMMLYMCSIVACMAFLRNYISDKPSLSEILESGLLFWIVPKIMLLLIGCTWKSPDSRPPGKNDKRNETVLRWQTFSTYPFVVQMILYTTCPFGATIVKFDTDDNFSYTAAIPAGCYLILTIYYFLLMVVSCASKISYERRESHYKDFLRSFHIIARYHLGTVCYQATLILPRIHATYVMNEKEFKNPKLSLIKRFYLTHWKVHDLSLMMTGAFGHNYSRSMRELLRLFTSDSPKLKNFQIHSKILKCCLTFLMALTNLTLISMWIHGIVFDPRIPTATWLAYIFASCIASLFLRFNDAAYDALWFRYDGMIKIEY